jgi:phosphatidylglycerophosphatase A
VGFPIIMKSQTSSHYLAMQPLTSQSFSAEAHVLGKGSSVLPSDSLLLDRFARWVAVAGGCGYSPLAPGTMGSIVGVAVFFCVGAGAYLFSGMTAPHAIAGAFPAAASGEGHTVVAAIYGVFAFGLFGLGCWAAGRAEIQFGRHDDGRIVIDEVVGQLIALFPLLSQLGSAGFSRLFPWVVTGFVLFRLFDVWKPGAIGWAERHFNGGLGVMADDVVAGVYAAICLFAGRVGIEESFRSNLLSVIGWDLGAMA